MSQVAAKFVIIMVFWMVLGFDSAVAISPYGEDVLALKPEGFWQLNETNGTTSPNNYCNQYYFQRYFQRERLWTQWL